MLLLDHLLIECSFIFVSINYIITEPSQFSLIPRLLPVQFFDCMYSVADKRIEPGNEAKSVGNMT